MTFGMSRLSTAAISIVAYALQRGASVLLVVGGSHILGSPEFGKFALVNAFSVNIGVVAIDSLSATVGVYAARKLAQSDTAGAAVIRAIIRVSFLVAILMSIAAFAGADILARIIAKGDAVGDLYKIAAMILLFQVPSAVINAALYPVGRGRAAAICTGVMSTINVISGLLCARYFGVSGMCAALAVTSLLGCVTYLWLLPPAIRNPIWTSRGWRSSFSELPVKDFMVPTTLAMLFTTPVHLVCMNMLAASKNGLHETAIFSAFYVICSLFMFIPAALSNFVIPHLSHSRSKAQERFTSVAAMTFASTASASMLLLIGVFVTRNWIVLLFGVDFRQSENVLVLLAVVGFTNSLLISANQLMWITGRSVQNLGVTSLCAICYLLATTYLVLHLGGGAAGLATALIIAQCLQLFILASVFVGKRFAVKFNLLREII